MAGGALVQQPRELFLDFHGSQGQASGLAEPAFAQQQDDGSQFDIGKSFFYLSIGRLVGIETPLQLRIQFDVTSLFSENPLRVAEPL